MPKPPLQLALSHGQVAWCLARGVEPSQLLLDQLRYLRQLGIPFEPKELGQGRGVRVTYGFYHFVEVGVAFEALRRRIQPRFLSVLVEDRARYRNLYDEAYRQIIKSLERDEKGIPIFEDEFYLRLHDRYSDTPGRIVPAMEKGDASARKFGDWVEQIEGQPDRDVIALKSLMAVLLRLAQHAPRTRTGPKG